MAMVAWPPPAGSPVLPATTREKRSGKRATNRKPINPP
jgi:hypothetical protein